MSLITIIIIYRALEWRAAGLLRKEKISKGEISKEKVKKKG